MVYTSFGSKIRVAETFSIPYELLGSELIVIESPIVVRGQFIEFRYRRWINICKPGRILVVIYELKDLANSFTRIKIK